MTNSILVPIKLLQEAHACMRATGWHLAPAAQTSDDGVIEAGVVDDLQTSSGYSGEDTFGAPGDDDEEYQPA